MNRFEQGEHYPLWCRLAGGRPNLRRTPIHAVSEHHEAEPPAAGIAARRRDHGGAGAGAPPPRPGAADRATAGGSTRKRIAAVAGRRGDRAHHGCRRQQARLYGDRRDALAVRPVGRSLGRDLLHRLYCQGRRHHEPPDHLRVQRRAGRRLGVPQPGRGRPAHRRVRHQRRRWLGGAPRRQSRYLAGLHRSGDDRSGRLRLEPGGQARRQQRVLGRASRRRGPGQDHCPLSFEEQPFLARPNTSWAKATAVFAPPRWRARCSASRASSSPAS